MTDKPGKFDRDVSRFFAEELLPLAQRLKADGVKLMDPGPQPGATSYYNRRHQPSMTRADFEQGGLSTPQRAEAEMRAAWSKAIGHPLAPLVPGVARLACELRQRHVQSSEVSAFVYAMY
jgi:hypothetical protein